MIVSVDDKTTLLNARIANALLGSTLTPADVLVALKEAAEMARKNPASAVTWEILASGLRVATDIDELEAATTFSLSLILGAAVLLHELEETKATLEKVRKVHENASIRLEELEGYLALNERMAKERNG